MRLVKWQRNAIYEAVVEGGLEIRDCTFDYDDERSRITHVPSGSFLLLEGDASKYIATPTVGENPVLSGESFSWSAVEDRVQRWAEDVKRDFDTPDLWAELERERDLLAGACFEDVANTPFTPEEQEQIAAQLTDAKELVRAKFELDPAQLDRIETSLDYLAEAAKRSRRLDWRYMLIGAVLSEMMEEALIRPLLQLLFILLRGLAEMFGGGDPALPGGPPELV